MRGAPKDVTSHGAIFSPGGSRPLNVRRNHSIRSTPWSALAATSLAIVLAGCTGSTADAEPAGPTTLDPPATTVTPSPSPTLAAASSSVTGAVADCSATTQTGLPAAPDVTGVSPAALITARTLFDSAKACDASLLISLATKDQTHLSFGVITPEEAFALPERSDHRFAAMIRTLSTPPATDNTSGRPLYIWPAVAAGGANADDAAWRAAVDAGLLTAAEADQMRGAGGDGYLSWRIGVDGTDGTWQFMVAGD